MSNSFSLLNSQLGDDFRRIFRVHCNPIQFFFTEKGSNLNCNPIQFFFLTKKGSNLKTSLNYLIFNAYVKIFLTL